MRLLLLHWRGESVCLCLNVTWRGFCEADLVTHSLSMAVLTRIIIISSSVGGGGGLVNFLSGIH